MKSEQLLERVLRSPRLPSLPAVALEVIELVQRKDVNIDEIARTLQHDPALAGKILKTVNTSFYGQAHTVANITHALVVLGLNSVKTLALGFSLASSFRQVQGEGFDQFLFWKRSLYSATAAKHLAQETNCLHHEEVFLAGLFQDLGVLALHQALGDPYTALFAQAGTDHRRLVELERARLGLDHAQVGAALAESWRLPPVLVEPIRHHENPDQAQAQAGSVLRLVRVGNRVADLFLVAHSAQALEAYYTDAEQWCGLDRREAAGLLQAIHEHSAEMRRLFDLPTGELEHPGDILARANEALMELSLQSQQQTDQLQQQNRELTEAVGTDSLTDTANRRRFNQFITDAFATARAEGSALSVLFMDVDHFKQFNDTYGHPTGDRVLVEVAGLLKRTVPASGLVCRYGGEEFAVILPGTSRREAAMLAERVRTTLEQAAVASDEGRSLRITASIGVASDQAGVFECVEQLVKAADQGVYAAKRAGRNCVRVFTPRPRHHSPAA